MEQQHEPVTALHAGRSIILELNGGRGSVEMTPEQAGRLGAALTSLKAQADTAAAWARWDAHQQRLVAVQKRLVAVQKLINGEATEL